MPIQSQSVLDVPLASPSGPSPGVALTCAELKAVLVHGGARDAYQLAIALSENGLLESLVTDLFWPADRSWARSVQQFLTPGLLELVSRRSAPALPSAEVRQSVFHGVRGFLLDKLPHVPFSWRRRSTRSADAALGCAAGLRARRLHAPLITYSYVAYDAISAYRRPAMLFQAHPHPAFIRNILQEELALHPECAASLLQEWELALPDTDYQHLVAEPAMASHILVASSFTRRSLMENGVSPERITVIPYGVDLQRFTPAARPRGSRTGRLELLFVGRINQRKGVSYLLEALRSFSPEEVHLTVCGRVVDDLKLFEEFGSRVTIRPSVSNSELIAAYQAADLFVFPSVAEGFGQVLLEALACGLPILTTTHTAAPDLIEDGVQGFIVEPRRPDLLVERIRWALRNPDQLMAMRVQARRRAEHFTWIRFRSAAADAVKAYLAP